MQPNHAITRQRLVTTLGLVIGAVGIAILWAAGVAFPVYPPPGIIILGIGVLLVALGPWRWVPLVGVALGAFVFVGFLVSPTGIPNLLGRAGAAVALGQAVQILGVLIAIIAGVITTRASYRR